MKKIYLGLVLAALTIGIVMSIGAQATSCDMYGLGGCFPWNPDSDNDGICNSQEINVYNTNPYLLDTDNGGACDGDEVVLDGTDPKYPTDDLM